MSRILGLDIGDKTIGVAISDETGKLALPLKTIVRGNSVRSDMKWLKPILESYQVTELAVGLPLSLDGGRGVQAEKVAEVVASMKRFISHPIHLVDERFTTVEAERRMIEDGVRRSERKRSVDSVAACLILQSFLDRRSALGTNPSDGDFDE
ncbi:MAG: Holliday junction resolvase RuvX [Armatimonadetes bacterium]|nr:Holliday junction resolvase RuvX [Armatimonadota bacterium]